MDCKNEFLDTLSGEDLQAIINRLPNLTLLLDMDGNILCANERAEKVFGYSDEEILDKHIWNLYPESDENDFRKSLQILKSGKNYSNTLKGKHKNGSSVWMNIRRETVQLETGTPLVLESASNINSLKEAEKELEKSKARIQAILETAVEGIIAIDKRGNIQDMNESAEKIFGYKSEEVIGENVKILMPSPYHEEHDQYMENYLTTGERKIIGIGREVRGKRKDGTVFPMELAVSEIKFEDELIFAGFIKDISDRRELENEILQISEDERRRIGQELHDGLGQMLSGINLISQNLARKLKANGVPGADEVKEISDMIREADEYARNLAHGLAHIELDNEGIEVAMRRLCERFQTLSHVKCEFECPHSLNIDQTVSLHLYRIAQEAIHNATKHGNASQIAVRLEKSENYMKLFVEDNGDGFNNSGQQNKNGGMGLSTMRHRAHILGGHLNFNSSSEGGVQVVCTVPIPKHQNPISN